MAFPRPEPKNFCPRLIASRSRSTSQPGARVAPKGDPRAAKVWSMLREGLTLEALELVGMVRAACCGAYAYPCFEMLIALATSIDTTLLRYIEGCELVVNINNTSRNAKRIVE